MKIYTKQGDKGTTAVYAKEVLRVDKDDILVDTYGTLDELNSFIGLLISQVQRSKDSINNHTQWIDSLTECQQDLFAIGFALSDTDKLSSKHVEKLEHRIDEIQKELKPQTHFILPGGSQESAQAHVIRTIARRAERMMVRLSKHHSVNHTSIVYLNRLSDFMFVLARYFNSINNVDDVIVQS